jgi:hypothetical protein
MRDLAIHAALAASFNPESQQPLDRCLIPELRFSTTRSGAGALAQTRNAPRWAIVAAQHRSFWWAAEALNIRQSTLSRCLGNRSSLSNMVTAPHQRGRKRWIEVLETHSCKIALSGSRGSDRSRQRRLAVNTDAPSRNERDGKAESPCALRAHKPL